MLLTRWATSGKSRPLSGPQFLICQARVGRAGAEDSRAVTAPLPPRRAGLRESLPQAPSGPPLPAPRPPDPHPEPLLLVRLDFGVQLPQRVGEAAEKQVLADQLVSALHGLRHRCAGTVSHRCWQGKEGQGLGRAGRGLVRPPCLSHSSWPTSPHASRSALRWPRPRHLSHRRLLGGATRRRAARPSFLAAVAAALSSTAAAILVKWGWTLGNVPESRGEQGAEVPCSLALYREMLCILASFYKWGKPES